MIKNWYFEGEIKKISTKEVINDKLTKQSIMLVDESWKYPQGVVIDFFNDNIKQLDGINITDQVKVLVNFKVNEYNNKRYNSISGWKIKKATEKEDNILPF